MKQNYKFFRKRDECKQRTVECRPVGRPALAGSAIMFSNP
jgi:hypothetical protein